MAKNFAQPLPIRAGPANPEVPGDFAREAPFLQVANGSGAFTQLRHVVGLRRLQHARVARYFLASSGGFGFLARGSGFLGHGDADSTRQSADCLREACPGMLYEESECAAMRPASKAVIELLRGTDSKRRGFFVVKGAQPEQVDAPFLQLHIPSDDIRDINAGKEILDKGIRDQRSDRTWQAPRGAGD